MNLFNLLSDIEATDKEAVEKYSFSRRKMLKTTSVAAASSAFFFTATVNNAFAQSNPVTDVLNFALLLEYLEAEFYSKGLSSGLNFGSARGLFEEIAKHEAQHVAYLKSALGGAAIPKPEFDYTAKGMFPNPFTNYEVFLTLSQAFEDTGVRAYKGQAPNLISNRDVLEAALRIHSVEARHAGEIRLVRSLRPYASEMETGGVPAAVYAGENNTSQHPQVDLISLVTNKLLLQDGTQRPAEKYVREAFDEPLTKQQVMNIVSPFVK